MEQWRCYKCGVDQGDQQTEGWRVPKCGFHRVESVSYIRRAGSIHPLRKVKQSIRTFRSHRVWKRKRFQCLDCNVTWQTGNGRSFHSKRQWWWANDRCAHIFHPTSQSMKLSKLYPTPMLRNYNYKQNKLNVWESVTSDYTKLLELCNKMQPIQLDEWLMRCIYSFKKERNFSHCLENLKTVLGFDMKTWESTSELVRLIKYCLNCAHKADNYCKLNEEFVYNIFDLMYCKYNNKMHEFEFPEMEVAHTFELLTVLCVTIETILWQNPKQEKPDNVKSLQDFVIQIKSLLLSIYNNNNFFEEFRTRALHLYCLYVFCARNSNVQSSHYFLQEQLNKGNTKEEIDPLVVESITNQVVNPDMPLDIRIESFKALNLIAELYDINDPKVTDMQCLNSEMKELKTNWIQITTNTWQIETLSGVFHNTAQRFVASSFAAKLKFNYLSKLLGRDLLEILLDQDTFFKQQLCQAPPCNKSAHGRNFYQRKNFLFKNRRKARDVKQMEQSESIFGVQFTHHIKSTLSVSIDYYEEKVVDAPHSFGSVWKSHESRKLRTQRRSTLSKVNMNSLKDIDRIIYDYELPYKKTSKIKRKPLQ